MEIARVLHDGKKELFNSKENKTMKQETKWYNPFTWFTREPNENQVKMEELAREQAQDLSQKMHEALTEPLYTPPRNIPKRKPAPKKKGRAKKTKPAKKKARK
jgi:hypothetical protein